MAGTSGSNTAVGNTSDCGSESPGVAAAWPVQPLECEPSYWFVRSTRCLQMVLTAAAMLCSLHFLPCLPKVSTLLQLWLIASSTFSVKGHSLDVGENMVVIDCSTGPSSLPVDVFVNQGALLLAVCILWLSYPGSEVMFSDHITGPSAVLCSDVHDGEMFIQLDVAHHCLTLHRTLPASLSSTG